MPVVEASITIDAPKDKLFALSQDYHLRLEWDPFLREMIFLGGKTEATLGGHVWVKSKRGLTMEVEYTTLDPPDRVAVKMIRGPFIFERFGGSWLFDALSPQGTSVRFRYSFVTRWAFLRPLLDPVIRWVFQRDIEARLRGLKRAAETTDILQHLPSADHAR
jgi:ribosome-associated toxin RatA of RatAB toxin-antitoxin module